MKVWKQSPYANYEVSKCGFVRDTRTGEETEGFIGSSNDYRRVNLKLPSDKVILIEVHRIVAETFIPKPNKTQRFIVDHIVEDDKLNNHVTNLQWLTQSENMLKSWAYRKSQGLIKKRYYLTEREKEEVIAEYLSGKSLVQLTQDLNHEYSRSTSRSTYTKVVRDYAK